MSKSKTPQEAPSSQPTGDLSNYRPLIKEWAALRLDKKDIEAKITKLDKQLKPVISGRGELRVDDYTINCTEAAGRRSLDKKKVEEFIVEHGGNVDDFYSVGAPSMRVTVKETKAI